MMRPRSLSCDHSPTTHNIPHHSRDLQKVILNLLHGPYFLADNEVRLTKLCYGPILLQGKLPLGIPELDRLLEFPRLRFFVYIGRR